MANMSMKEAMDQFVTHRIEKCEQEGSSDLAEALMLLRDCEQYLRNALNETQMTQFVDYKNAYAQVEKELKDCYYRNGFSDALTFVFGNMR